LLIYAADLGYGNRVELQVNYGNRALLILKKGTCVSMLGLERIWCCQVWKSINIAFKYSVFHARLRLQENIMHVSADSSRVLMR
jgi:hypothetical protein